MKKQRPRNLLRKKSTGWTLTHQHHQDDTTCIQIDVAPLVAKITNCLHVYYPDLQKSFTVMMDTLNETAIERIAEHRSDVPTMIEKEEVLSKEQLEKQTHCYLIREEPVNRSYSGIMRYVVRGPYLQEASKSLNLLIHVQVDALFEENSHIETIAASFPELGVEFCVMSTEVEGTDTQAIMDMLLDVMLVQGWDDGENGIHAAYGYRIIGGEEGVEDEE